MKILEIVMLVFISIELANVIILYYFPRSKKGNGVAIFNAYHRAQEDEEMALFANYMKNWVAGTKLIFIVLIVVILLFGNDLVKLFGVFSMILSILTYYFKLHPIIKRLDQMNAITPKGYSKTLGYMITGILVMFIIPLCLYFLN